MKWRINLMDEDNNEWKGTKIYTSHRALMRDYNAEMNDTTETYIDDNLIIGAFIEELPDDFEG